MLRIYDVVLEMARDVAVLCERLERADADLARQMRRAMTSVGLNVAEGMYSQGKNRRARYYTALGSAREVLASVEMAHAMKTRVTSTRPSSIGWTTSSPRSSA